MTLTLTPKESYAFYELGLLSSFDLVDLAVQWMEDGCDFESLCLLAGETEPEASIVQPLYLETMNDFGVVEPDRSDAINTVLKYYLQKINSNDGDPIVWGNRIYEDVYYNVVDTNPDREYVGDCIGIEGMCVWLREIWDAEDGDLPMYYPGLPRDKAIVKYKERLAEEANKVLDKLA